MIEPALFAELTDLCLRSFPGRLEQRLSQIAPQSTEHGPGLSFTLSWSEAGRLRVERLLLHRYADNRTWWSLRDGTKAQREWSVMRWLYGYGLPVPQVYALGTHNGDAFLLLEHPSGQAIDLGRYKQTSVHEETDRRAFQDKASQTLLHQCVDTLAKLMAQLHRLAAPDAVRKALPGIDVQAELERLLAISEQHMDRALEEAIRELEQDQVEAYPPCVLHGDPQIASLRLDARGATAWLNWENSALGDPRWDVACVVNELQRNLAVHLADHFCASYSDRADLPLHDMAYWQALTAVYRWAMTTRTGSTFETKDDTQLTTQLERCRKQAWQALARLRDTRTTVAGSADRKPEI